MPKVIEIVRAHLNEHGFDGLVSESRECGCRSDDLVPCCEDFGRCLPAHEGADPQSPDSWAMYESKDAAEASKTTRSNLIADCAIARPNIIG